MAAEVTMGLLLWYIFSDWGLTHCSVWDCRREGIYCVDYPVCCIFYSDLTPVLRNKVEGCTQSPIVLYHVLLFYCYCCIVFGFEWVLLDCDWGSGKLCIQLWYMPAIKYTAVTQLMNTQWYTIIIPSWLQTHRGTHMSTCLVVVIGHGVSTVLSHHNSYWQRYWSLLHNKHRGCNQWEQ